MRALYRELRSIAQNAANVLLEALEAEAVETVLEPVGILGLLAANTTDV